MREPFVSVIMAALNHEPFAAEAAASVLTQDYERLELIAVDDRSDDCTADVLEQCAADAPAGRMRVVRHDHRVGIARTRAHALRLARGALIGVLDSDDMWLPDKLGPQVELMVEERDVGLTHAEFEAFDSRTGAVIPWGERDWDRDADPLRELVRLGCFVMTGTALIRRSAIERRGLGFVDPGYPSHDDYLLYLTIALDWRLAHEERIVMRYRRHAGNLTTALYAQNVPRARVNLVDQFVRRFPEARPRLGRELRRTVANQLVLAATIERRRSRLRAARWAATAFGRDPSVALGETARVVRAKLAKTAKP
jgi:glycosyltransferase involved in cell wall biosynthesis